MIVASSKMPIVRGAAALGLGLVGYAVVAGALSSAAEERNVYATAGERPPGTLVDVVTDFGPDRVARQALRLHKAGFEYECWECHEGRKRDDRYRTFVGEHAKLRFDHGNNRRCFNCHHETVYDAFVAEDGAAVDYTDHVALCGRCHGPIYRDWRRGAHGRRAGYWDRRRGEQRRTDCIICHDPHHPGFAPIEPLPPPQVAVGPAHSHGAPTGVVARILTTRPRPPVPVLRAPAEPDWNEEGQP